MDAGYSPDYGSFYASIPPEELLRRLAFCAGLLPSPLFKMERLMPTNPAAQQQFLRKEEEEPPRARAMDRTLLLRAAMVRELFADSDEEEERPCFIKPQMKKREREEDSEEDAEPPRRRRMRQPSTCRFPLSHQRRSWLKILLPGSHYLISARRLLCICHHSNSMNKQPIGLQCLVLNQEKKSVIFSLLQTKREDREWTLDIPPTMDPSTPVSLRKSF
ncbi:uncharacterized protein [Engystomops pustulosus]|uniref:uncharacterized protein isoform X2 n=1 Tax=Engystomops pustulosus TaxID=76066 RepID=UPI003AFA58D2